MKRIIILVATISWALLIWRLTTSAQIMVTNEHWLQNILMMGAHFTFFGIQAVLLRLSLSTPLSLTIASLYGFIIELVQRTVPGRSADPLDWILDTLGAVIFLSIMKKYSKSI